MSITYVITAIDEQGAPELIAEACNAGEAAELVHAHPSRIGDAAQKIGYQRLENKFYDACGRAARAERTRRMTQRPEKFMIDLAGTAVWVQAK